jgi:hypothetical protein
MHRSDSESAGEYHVTHALSSTIDTGHARQEFSTMMENSIHGMGYMLNDYKNLNLSAP